MTKSEQNRLLNENEIKADKIVLDSKPRVLVPVLTNKCNLRCIMCSRIRLNKFYTLSFKLMKKLYKLFDYLEEIELQGGEVFLVDYFKELYHEIGKYPNIYKRIVTNGLLIDQELADILAKIGNLELTYSIDAVTKETYEKIRAGGKYSDLIRSLELINNANKKYSSNVKLRINATVMKYNYKEMEKYPEFCKKYNIENIRFDFMRPDVLPQEDIILSRDEHHTPLLCKIVEEMENKCKEMNIGFHCAFKPLITSYSNKTNVDCNSNKFKCKLPWKKMFVDIDGFIYPDCICQESIGNIADPIEEVWNSERMQLYRKNISNGSIDGWCSKHCVDGTIDSSQLEGIG